MDERKGRMDEIRQLLVDELTRSIAGLGPDAQMLPVRLPSALHERLKT